jgi:membrane protease YdiL (CAAX protease family)
MSLIGIDKNWKQDAFSGFGIGIAVILTHILSAKSFNFIIPKLPQAFSQIEMILIITLIAPIMEEGLRGVIIHFFKDKINLSTPLTLIIQGTLFFALYHGMAYGGLSYNLTSYVFASLMGILFGYLMIRTKSIITPIVTHIVINVYALMGTLVFF